MHRFVIALAAVACLACAGIARSDDGAANSAVAPPEAAASAAAVAEAASQPAPPQQHCWREYRVGSNFPKTRCESDLESETERQRRLADWNHSLNRANQVIKAPGP